MIEINLLPEDMRPTEGTPPARFASMILGVMVFCGIGALVGHYKLVKIPKELTDKKTLDAEVKKAVAEQDELKKVIAQITQVEQKVQTLEDLLQSRVRYARVLDRLCWAVSDVDGAWISRMNVASESGGGGPGAVGGGGKRYKIEMGLFTTAANALERDKKDAELINSLDKYFLKQDVVQNEKGDGLNNFVNARFYPPTFSGATEGSTPKLEANEQVLEALKTQLHEKANVSTITLRFEVPKLTPPAPPAPPPAPAKGAPPKA